MAVPSGEYGDGESGCGSSTGLGIFIAATVLVVLMTKVVSEVKKGSNINNRPNTEIRNSVDTFAISADTFNVKTK